MAKLFKDDDKKNKLPVLEKANTTGADYGKILKYDPNYGGAVSRGKASVIDWYEGMDDPSLTTKMADAITKVMTGKEVKRTTKADMLGEYQAAKEQQISDALKNYSGNADIPMLAGTYANQMLHPIQYDKAMNEIAPYLEQNGITTDQLAKYYATQALREQNRQMQNTAADNAAGNTLLSFATNQIGNLATGAGALESLLTGQPLGSNPVVNEYGKLTPTIRGTIREDIKENADTKVGGSIGAGAYDVATGIGDQLMSLALTGGSKMGTLGLMSYGAGASNLNEQLGKDTSDTQKLATAVTSGVIEGLTEYLPLDNLFRLAKGGAGSTVRQIVRGVVGQMLSEAGEEAVSEVANTISDNIINGAQSDYSQNVNAYMAQGLSQDEANKQAIKDVAGNAIYSAVIGGISGGIMGGGAITMNALGNRGNGNNNVQNNTLPAVEQLQENAPQTEELPALSRVPDVNQNWRLIDTLDYFGNQSNIAPDWTQMQMTQEEANAEWEKKPLADRIRGMIDPNMREVPELLKRSNPEDVIYHAGLLSRLNKAETNGQFYGSNRDTGYYGTGHYFVDNNTLNELNSGNYKKKPLTSVDISSYNNLFRADTDEKASNLHRFLSDMTRLTQGSDRNTIEEIYDEYKTAFKDQGNILPYDEFVNRVNSLTDYMKDSNMDDRGDSVSTQFMKSLGYGGVDTRGTRYADTRYGTVIYDLDEDSVLHGNVPVGERATTDMLTKSKNRNVFDAAEDARIQEILDKQAKGREVKARLREIYDDTELRQNEEKLEELNRNRQDVQSTIGDISNTLNNVEGYVRDKERLFADFDIEAPSEEEHAKDVKETTARFSESLAERQKELASIEEEIGTLEARNRVLYDEYSKAREQARKDVEARRSVQATPQPQTTQAEPVQQAQNVQQAQEQVPSLKKPKKSQKAQQEVPSIKKNETVNNAPVAQTEQTQVVPQVETQTQTQEQKPLVTIEPNGNPSITSQNTYDKSKAFQSEQAQAWLAKNREIGTFDVDRVSEKESVEKATKRMEEDYEGEARRIESDRQLEGYQVDEAMIMMEQKVDEALRTGDWSEVRRFSAMVNQKIHKVAQSLQALAKYSRSAEATIMKIERIVQELTGGTANISDEDYTRLKQIFDEADTMEPNSLERMNKEAEAYKLVAKYIPNTSFMEKWNAFRYLAMLGNTRTHIRNVFGNLMFGAVTNVKDALAGTIESMWIQDENKRTKSAFNHASLDMLKAASQDANNVWQELTDSGSNKYSMRNEIENEKKIFDNKLLEAFRKLNENLLTKEDNWALRNKYKRALAGYLEARGYDTSIFESKDVADQKVLKEARKYAIKQAKIATFHEESRTADMLNQWSKAALAKDSSIGQKAAGIAIEAMVPFKKTPVNILKQGAVAYNPIQMFHGVYDAIANRENPAKAIDEFSRGVTGSAIMALGYALASIGALRPSEKEDDDLDKLTGEQAYSINSGNKSYTIDWAAPAALPLFVGAELYKAFDDSADFDFWSALSSISDPVIEMSMLQGLKNSIESLASFASGKNTLFDMATNLGFGYASQGVPTALGQVARAVDDTRRSTYTGKTGTSDTILRNVKKIQNKIPGLSKLSEPYVDAWGETSENTGGSFLGRLAYNMLSPGYYSDTSKTGTEEELYRLKEMMDSGEIENHSIIPSVADKTYNKERLSPSDYTEISTQKGQNIQKLYTEAISNPKYQKMPDEKKAELLSSLNKFGNALSKAEIFDYDIQGSDTYKKRYEAYEQGGVNGLIDWMMFKDTLEGQTSAAAAISALDNMDVSDEEKIAFFKSGRDYSKKAQYLDSIDPMYAYDWYKIKSTYGDKKSAIEYGILISDLPDEEKQALMNVNTMKDAEVEYRLLIGQ